MLAMKQFVKELFENQLKMKYYFYTDKRFLWFRCKAKSAYKV
jgi:hypothetical protein